MLRKYKWLFAAIALVLIAGTVGYYNRMQLAIWGFDTFLSSNVEKELEKSYQPLEGREPVVVTHAETKQIEPFSLLLLGLDQRGGERGRSDTMLYTVVRPVDGALLMVSIPRDAYVEIPGRHGDKINHAYAYGEAELAVETVESLFDTKVDHYATVNFSGFRDVIDEMGGISLPIDKDLVNDDPGHEKFVVKAGQDLYNGQDALNYVRFREDAGGDISRTGRHQTFVNAVLERAGDIQNWSKIPQLIETMGDNFATDMKPDTIIDVAKAMVQADTRSIYGETLGGSGGYSDSGAWYFYLDEEDLTEAKSWIADWLDDTRTFARLPRPGQYDGGTGGGRPLSASEAVEQ
ncbi:LCP family protein [Paenibacillus sp. IB182496]|uniref:LCP family protein n=2 Tax=Paenibacillus sabuli TaxID=2772509 RepID=A0A927BY13_9BACL|nr:LCP family protein [Paenibacillus sabuli]